MFSLLFSSDILNKLFLKVWLTEGTPDIGLLKSLPAVELHHNWVPKMETQTIQSKGTKCQMSQRQSAFTALQNLGGSTDENEHSSQKARLHCESKCVSEYQGIRSREERAAGNSSVTACTLLHT